MVRHTSCWQLTPELLDDTEPAASTTTGTATTAIVAAIVMSFRMRHLLWVGNGITTS